MLLGSEDDCFRRSYVNRIEAFDDNSELARNGAALDSERQGEGADQKLFAMAHCSIPFYRKTASG
jgi:hypothetical protein